MEPKKYTVSSMDVEEFKKARSRYEKAVDIAEESFARWQDGELSADRLVDYISEAESLRREMNAAARHVVIEYINSMEV